MTNEQLDKAIGGIEEELLEENAVAQVKQKPPKTRRRKTWIRVLAAAACLCVIMAGVLYLPGRLHTHPQPDPTPDSPETPASSTALTIVEYPAMAAYPVKADGSMEDQAYDDWMKDLRQQLNQPKGYRDNMESFYYRTMQQFLSGKSGENRVYSPLNVYMALSLLAEIAGGESRQQILQLLEVDSIEALREKAAALWNANYRDDGAVTSRLANSLWLGEGLPYISSTLDTLKNTYFASAHQGKFGSAAYTAALRQWLNEQTDGLLENAVQGVEPTPDTVMTLASTVLFKAKWEQTFEPAEAGIFHAADGDKTVPFLRQTLLTEDVYWTETCKAVYKKMFNGDYGMWLLLPDEGVPIDGVLADGQVISMMQQRYEWKNVVNRTVHLSMPKFDVSAQTDLIPGLKALGVTDVFDAAQADFTPLFAGQAQATLFCADHAARVTVDEEGCKAAAYTVMMLDGASPLPGETVDFVLDRPFVFAITGADGSLLFAGVVEQP